MLHSKMSVRFHSRCKLREMEASLQQGPSFNRGILIEGGDSKGHR